MDLFEISGILLTAAAVGSYVNDRWIRIPSSIGLMLLAMGVGLCGMLLEAMGLVDIAPIDAFLRHIDFSETVFHGMLSFLLFAGASQINIDDLKSAKLPVTITATFSTLISTVLIGFAFYALADAMGFSKVNLFYALLFGAIISPTDPIAVIGIIKKMNAPKAIETKIAGESLFNDGVAIVFYLTILELISGKSAPTLLKAAELLVQEAGGGLLIGGVIGWVAHRMLTHVESYQSELLITLAVASGGYLLAEKLHVSGPIAMVVSGIIIGNRGRDALSAKKREHIDSFWELVDEILNAVLFMLIGLEMMVIRIDNATAMLSAICIPVALAARFLSIAIPLQLMKPFYAFQKGTTAIMTWGGLRGALSIAMVLALNQQEMKELFLPCVYFVAVFSIAVQGMTFSRLLKKYDMT
ncbi:MAG TPA: sodium:proton antiporter [Burkholderiales bacterium]|nr:sodium:proton antiporter [Burkholderiales bacterium]